MFFFLPYHTGSKRHQGQACQFKELSSERNSNNSDAPQQSDNQITERHFPSEENNPDQIDQKRKHTVSIYYIFTKRPECQRCKLKALHPNRYPDNGDTPDTACKDPR